ncbi:AraC family transcriptional regulator [Lichenifustis flavocetrariae]|uniref:Helix-turn-helix domain-containing protein n=1 Tax=Lichenifustis flavocetrariae TaxID=2949735 RepID=A0AA42CRF4_9HYPH|nr:helix-turn-helix domain-containing protein [Lichenifustis flavocetrariae]MCW6512437.1 helix-turn-helix domain-containing protein [Lichenifustis flavocetrariae]
MLLVLPPAPELAALVQAYWFVEDRPGAYEGLPIRTSPIPFAVLSVNMGRPNASEDGSLIPRVSLLGLQSRHRTWRSWSDTYFVMAMLTVPGIVRLFGNTGLDAAEALLELGAVTGDALATSLASDIDAASAPQAIATRLDRWLTARLSCTAAVPESRRIVAAHDVLRRGGSVQAAAEVACTDRRQLHRWFRRHLGMGPKDLADLERLHASLRSVQAGRGDPVAGFSDQAHQIRSWRRRLGVTPGAYRSTPGDRLTGSLASSGETVGLAFYL